MGYKKWPNTEEMMEAILRLDPGASIRYSLGEKKWYISSIIDIKREDGTKVRAAPLRTNTWQAVRDTYDMLIDVEYPDVIVTYRNQQLLWNGRQFAAPRIGPAREPFAVTT